MGDDSFADVARRALHDAGYSIRAAAKATHYDPSLLSRCLNGKAKPSLKLAEALDALLGTGGALAGIVLRDDERGRVAASAANPGRLDAGTVDALAGVLAAFRRLDDSVTAPTIAPAVLVQTKEVTRLLKGARGPHRNELAAVVSEHHLFMGWLLAQDGKHAAAGRWLTDAVGIADEIQDGTLSAAALNFMGYSARAQGNPQGVARWFAAAAATPGAHPAQRVGDILQSAAGVAQLGRRSDALRLVGEAETLMDQAAARPAPAVAYWLDGAFLRLNLGIASAGLGRYGDAVDHFTAGLAGLPDHLRSAPWTAEHRGALARAEALR
jgi:hypothetical protein